MSGSKIRVGIAGGGAAGLYAACCLAKFSGGKDIEITVIERNSIPGKKLILTGHGRCNITNRKDASDLKKGYHEAENFIYPALREFGPEETIRFFENDLGLAVKEEDNNRIFPVCDTLQVKDYSKYEMSGFSEEHKKSVYETEFPKALELAFKVGAGQA